VETEVCNATPCSGVVGRLRPWEPWTPCTRTCGAGRKWRKRVCSVLNACDGFNAQSESEFCNVQSCLGDRRVRRRRVLEPITSQPPRRKRTRRAKKVFIQAG
jgi:hypothetical protein